MIQIIHCKCGYTHVMKGNLLYSYKTKPPFKLKTIINFLKSFVHTFDRLQNIGFNVLSIGKH